MKKLLAVIVMVAACGGGVDGSKKLSELSAQEAKDACNELAEDFPEKTVMCSAEVTITVGLTAAECANETPAPAACTATVDEARACTEALYNQTMQQLCSDAALPAACMKLTNC